jgi:hypothetical protein
MYLDMDINWIWGWLALAMSLLQDACICRVAISQQEAFLHVRGV